MSDPMTNVQIEDVLSSIRKLVAEGDKSKAAARPAETETRDGTPPATDRLVLTAALRVSNDDVAPVSTESEQPVADADVPFEDEPTPRAAGAFVLRNVIEDAVEIVFDDNEQPAPTPEPAETVATFRHFDREALSQTDIPLKAMEMPEPATSVADGNFEDEMIPDTAADPQIDEKLTAFLSDEAMLADAGLDEKVLRQLIVEVIREELQGTLGEQITRNVRKLVRREIHRVIASHDVE